MSSIMSYTKVALDAVLGSKSPLVSPNFSGNPTAPTPDSSDNDVTIATTAFVQNLISDLSTQVDESLSDIIPADTSRAVGVGELEDSGSEYFYKKVSNVVAARDVNFTPANPDYTLLNALGATLHAAGGGTILLEAGVYLLAGSISWGGYSNLTLKGDPSGGTIFRMTNGLSARLMNLRGVNVHISHIQFDGGTGTENLALRTGGIVIENLVRGSIHHCVFRNVGQPVRILPWGSDISSDIEVHHNTFEATIRDHAVRAVESSPARIWVHHNLVHNVLNGGADGETSAFRATGPDHIYNDNIVLGSYDTGLMITGLGSVNIKSFNNTFISNQVSIFMGSASSYCSSVDDTVTSVNDHGMHIYTPDSYGTRFGGHTVRGLRVKSAGKCGIQVQGVIWNKITDCFISNVGQKTAGLDLVPYTGRDRAGITLMATVGGNAADRNIISNNTIIDTQTVKTMQYGVYIDLSAQDYIRINNNSVADAVSGQFFITSRNASSVENTLQTTTLQYNSLDIPVRSFTTAGRPSASSRTNVIINDTTLGVLVRSDGTNWRRLDTNAIV